MMVLFIVIGANHHQRRRRRRMTTMRGGMVIYVVVVVVIVQLLLFHATIVQSHGYLSTPRSRNLVAYQDRVYYPITSADPLPEDCPQCLNRGGSLARCGIMNARQLNENNDASQERNYDLPQNALGEPMPSNPQMTYVEGSVIDVEVILTAHHRGHFIFKACPISSTVEDPSQECFDNNPLLFVSDTLYGATIDTNYPERVYVAPSAYVEHFLSEDGFNSMLYQYQMKLPDGLVGELVLIQWYYVAANSDCIHPGYDTYDWPTDWNISTSNAIVSSSWEEEEEDETSSSSSLSLSEESSVGTTGLQLCEDVLPVDGNGKPEQFWNCAEVTITKSSNNNNNNNNNNVQPPQEDTSTTATATATSSTVNSDEGASDAEEVNPPPQDTTTTAATTTTTSSTTVGVELTVTESATQQQDTTTITTTASSPFSSMAVNSNGNKLSKTIIGYYASWQWYDRNELAIPSNMDFTKVTRVNFAFFQTNTNGSIWGTDSWADPIVLFGPFNWNPPENETEVLYCSWDSPTNKACNTHSYEEGLIYQVHAAGAEIYPSLGGWSLSDPFPEMAANEETRMNFVNNCVDLVKEYGFDGIDIDWEYPGYEDHSGTPADTYNYNLLLRDLRSKLDELGESTDKFYGLTAALPCGTSNIANMDIETIAKYLTEFNLMTYDFFGDWSPTTGTNAPLYDQEWGDKNVTGFSVDGCVRNWMKGGASPSAINIGLPFYGRSFTVAKGLNEAHEGNDKGTWYQDDGSPQYFNIVEKLSEFTSVRHEPTKTQYAYKESGGLVSYDDEQAICDKAEYCLEHDLNGFIIWELSGDLMADLSTPLLDTVVNKLADPTLDCRLLANSNATIEYSSTTDGNATAEIAQSTSSPSEEPRPPSQAPIIIQPSIRPSSAPIVVPSDLSTSSESPSTIPSQYPTVPSESDIYETQQFTIFPTSSGSVETPGLSSATPTSVLTSRPSRIRPIRTLSPSRLPSLSPAVLHTESPVMQLSVTQEPSSEQYPNEPSLPPTEHSPILLTTQPSLTSETDTFNSDLSPVFDDRPASTTLTGSIENSGNNTHQTQTTADSQAGAPSIPDENVPYYWSSTSDISSTEYVPNSGLPQDFSFDGPFISVELFLKDHPGDIGWQLLRPDGTSVVEKPVGSYSSLEPDTVVYEFIPIQPLTSSRSIVGDELQWTIINVRGMGLNGGHWNMFSAAPTEGTLLATGDDFGYTDTVWLLVSNEGHISLRDIGLNQQPPESIPSTSVSVDAMQSQDSTDAVNDSLHEKANESLGPNNVQNPQPTTKKRPVLTPSLALIVAVAVVAGICLLFLAFRNARAYYGGNGEVVDEWNIEEPPDEDFSEDNYYPESEQDIMYDEDHSESIDPSGSFDSYEENNTTDSRLDELPKEKRSRAYSGRDEATDAFENEGLSHHLSLDTFGEILSMDAAARSQFFHDSDVNENFGMSNDSVDNIYDLVREQIREKRSESNDPNRGQRRRHSIL